MANTATTPRDPLFDPQKLGASPTWVRGEAPAAAPAVPTAPPASGANVDETQVIDLPRVPPRENATPAPAVAFAPLIDTVATAGMPEMAETLVIESPRRRYVNEHTADIPSIARTQDTSPTETVAFDVPDRARQSSDPAPHGETIAPAAHGESTVEAPQNENIVPAEQNEVRVPVVEERLRVEKQTAIAGEVVLHRSVTEELASVTVEVRRERIGVSHRDVAPRPLRPQEATSAFQEHTIHIPVIGETAFPRKTPVVTGEVVLHRTCVPQRRELTETTRHERIEVTEERTQGTQATEDVDPGYRRGFEAAREARYAGRSFEEAEPELRREFESANPGAAARWKQMLADVRQGWARARQRRNLAE